MTDEQLPTGTDANPFAVESANPYAPTSNVSEVELATSDVEGYRRKYLSHEASVKSIGTLYMLGAIFLVPVGVIMLGAMLFVSQDVDRAESFIIAGIGLLYTVLGILQGLVAIGLRRLDGRARIGAVVFSVIGLIGFPIGTLISAYFLYLLLSEKGQIVFSEHYKKVIEQTPHIKYKTSVIVWIFLGLLLLLIGLGIVGALLG